MPIPEPKEKEKKDDFIQRCMSDDIMLKEIPDESQRYIICLTQWRDGKKDE